MNMPDRSLQFESEAMRMNNRLIDWGLCWLRGGGGRDILASRPDVVEVSPREEGTDNPRPEDCRIVMSKYRDPNPDYERQFWTPADIRAAEILHGRVIRLPLVAQRMVLQVFYGESYAVLWPDMTPDEKQKAIRLLTTWPSPPYGVNARIARYNKECGDHVAPIKWQDFETIKHHAIRLLIARERGIPE